MPERYHQIRHAKGEFVKMKNSGEPFKGVAKQEDERRKGS